jgi:hypothetical protein
MGTRGLSAGDWTRMQRLRGAKPYGLVSGGAPVGNSNIGTQFALNSDITTTPGPQQPYGPALLVKPVVGTSRVRRTAGQWTDYVASGHADFYTMGQTTTSAPGLSGTLNVLGSGTTTKAPGWGSKAVVPGVNALNRLKILS